MPSARLHRRGEHRGRVPLRALHAALTVGPPLRSNPPPSASYSSAGTTPSNWATRSGRMPATTSRSPCAAEGWRCVPQPGTTTTSPPCVRRRLCQPSLPHLTLVCAHQARRIRAVVKGSRAASSSASDPPWRRAPCLGLAAKLRSNVQTAASPPMSQHITLNC